MGKQQGLRQRSFTSRLGLPGLEPGGFHLRGGVDVDHLEDIGSDGAKCVRCPGWRYDHITGRCRDGSSSELEARAPCEDHKRLRVWVTVQRRPLSVVHVHDEERNLGTVGGTLELACLIRSGGPPRW
jgi:hypothetical protein